MKIIYGYHKKSDNDIVNLINYMSHGFIDFKDHSFLGFIPIDYDGVNIGVKINNKKYTACHVFYTTVSYGYDDEGIKDKPYILMFYGVDDTSYYLRFNLKQEAIDYFNNIKTFDYDTFHNCYLYN